MKKISLFFGICYCLFAAPPKWFLQTNQQDSMFVGNGSATDIKQAKANALADLVSFINVSVDSSLSMETQRNDASIQTNVQNNINLETKDIELLNIQILRQESSDGVYYMQVGIKKEDFVAQMQKEIMQLLEKSQGLQLNICEFVTPDVFNTLEMLANEAQSKVKFYEIFAKQVFVDKRLSNLLNAFKINSPKPKVNAMIRIKDLKIQNAVLKEISKFSILNAKAIAGYPTWEISIDKPQDVFVMDIELRDCKDNVIYQEQILLDDKNLHRANFVFYKKIKDWLNQ